MTDDQLRTLVRDAVARHLGLPASGGPGGAAGSLPGQPPVQSAGHSHGHPHAPFQGAPMSVHLHASHGRYPLARGSEDGGAGSCLIEPSVTCNHCGYCQSHGH